MKKNGFIATSVLYSFFIVFITLFVALIANFVHNRMLIDSVDEESLKVITATKNTKISDLVVGDKVHFANTSELLMAPGATQSANNLINDSSTWVVADIQTSGSKKIYYFLSDMQVGSQFTYKRENDVEVRTHTITVDIFNEINNMGLYQKALLYNNLNTTYPITISLPTISVLQNLSRNPNVTDTIKNSIFNTSSNFTIYADKSVGSYVAGSYYNMRYYIIPKGVSNDVLSRYCNSTFNGTTVNYPSSNVFGYTNVGTDAKKTTKLVNYCLYANPGSYSHPISDNIVYVPENNITDHIPRTAALGWDLTTNTAYDGGVNAGHDIIGYNIRLMATVVIDPSNQYTYISGGKGTSVDPYLITNGLQGRYQSSQDKITSTSKALADIIMKKANYSSIKNYNNGDKTQAYVFAHESTSQMGATPDYRFIGNNPYNYVQYNGELWRIIGVFNQNGENRIKLIRDTPFSYPWNSSGANEWTSSTLYSYLNNGYRNALTAQAKNQMAVSSYYLGGHITSVVNASDFYKYERGYSVSTGRSISANNYLGVMYPSDYAYTFAYNVNASCYNNISSCGSPSSSWLYKGIDEYLITPVSNSTTQSFYLSSAGSIGIYPSLANSLNVRPVVYLNHNVEVVSGSGASIDPYILG